MASTIQFISLDNLKTIWDKIRRTFSSKEEVELLESRIERLETLIVNVDSLINVAGLNDIENLQAQINELKAKVG